MSNATCFAKKAPQKAPPLFENGHIHIQAHTIGWIVSGVFALIATAVSIWLVNRHLQWYTNKSEQRYIVRLLLMVPIYAWISFLSYLFWDHSTPLLLIRDGYESTVLTAFFYLLLMYLSPSPDEQKAIFRKVGLSKEADRDARRKGEKEGKWMFPLGFIKWKPLDGLYFLQLMKWGVLQYCVIRPTTTLIAVILNYVGLYCEDSWSLGWGHIWITVVVSISVTVAMYCLIQLYVPIASHLAPQKPLLKLFAIKAVVFLTFWQATLLSILSMFGVVKDTPYMTADDINIGYGAILETFEMMLFALLHIKAFSYKPYAFPAFPTPLPTRTPRLLSLAHAFDFRETLRELWEGCVYIVDRIRGNEPRPDKSARRTAILESVFGRRRPVPAQSLDKGIEVKVMREVGIEVDGERQWLGLGDNYAYGLTYASRKEKSDDLGEQIEKELQKRVLTKRDDMLPYHVPQRSWWRDIYARISHSGTEPEAEENRFSALPRRKSRRFRTHSTDFDSPVRQHDKVSPNSQDRSHHRRGDSGSKRPTENSAGVHTDPSMDVLSFSQFGMRDSPSPLPSGQPDSLLGRIFLPESTASLTPQSKSASPHDTMIHVLPQLSVTANERYPATSNMQGFTMRSSVEMVDEFPTHVHVDPTLPTLNFTKDELSAPPPFRPTNFPQRPSHRRESAQYRRSDIAHERSPSVHAPLELVTGRNVPKLTTKPRFPTPIDASKRGNITSPTLPPPIEASSRSPSQPKHRFFSYHPTPIPTIPAPLSPQASRPAPAHSTIPPPSNKGSPISTSFSSERDTSVRNSTRISYPHRVIRTQESPATPSAPRPLHRP